VDDIRIPLTDKSIALLPAPNDGWYLARDTELRGFFVVIGRRKRTFTIQGDLRKDGKRVSSIRVSIGDTREISIRSARATAKEYLAQISRGQHPNPPQDEPRAKGPFRRGGRLGRSLLDDGLGKKTIDSNRLEAGRVQRAHTAILLFSPLRSRPGLRSSSPRCATMTGCRPVGPSTRLSTN